MSIVRRFYLSEAFLATFGFGTYVLILTNHFRATTGSAIVVSAIATAIAGIAFLWKGVRAREEHRSLVIMILLFCFYGFGVLFVTKKPRSSDGFVLGSIDIRSELDACKNAAGIGKSTFSGSSSGSHSRSDRFIAVDFIFDATAADSNAVLERFKKSLEETLVLNEAHITGSSQGARGSNECFSLSYRAGDLRGAVQISTTSLGENSQAWTGSILEMIPAD